MRRYIVLIFFIVIITGFISYSPNLFVQKVQEGKKTTNNKEREDPSIQFYRFDTDMKFSLDDLVPFFSSPDFNLVPQGDGDYPKLNGVEPSAYELIDGTVFIYIFSDSKDLKKGATQIQEVYRNKKWKLKVYEMNNMMFVYSPSFETEELMNENHNKMIEAINAMVKASTD